MLIFLFLVISKRVTGEKPNPADYGKLVGGRCPFMQFDCDPTARMPLCIPFSAVRDCVPDCPNMSDEWCGSGKIICDLGFPNFPCGQCVKPEDLSNVCLERKWEHLCSEPNTIKCARTHNCVLQKWLMDGRDDCGDSSDEDPCNSGIITCETSSQPQTPPSTETTQGRTRPTKPTRLNESDTQCDYGYFRCMDGSCLDETLVLDGNKDCPNGDDEEFCSMNEDQCNESHPCTYQPDISAFGCGCPKGFEREEPGICRPRNGPKYASNCFALKALYPHAKSGPKKLHRPGGFGVYDAYCDMEEGALVFLRHASPNSNFNRSFAEYEIGFDDGEDFWLGNQLLHQLTCKPHLCRYELIVNLTYSKTGQKEILRYSDFQVKSPSDRYRLQLGAYLSKEEVASDHLAPARNQRFLTFDTFAGLCKMPTGWWAACVDCGKTAPTNAFIAAGAYGGLTWAGERISSIEMGIRPSQGGTIAKLKSGKSN